MRNCFKLSSLALFLSLPWDSPRPSPKTSPKETSDTIKGTTVKFDLVQLPAGKIKVGDKEVEIKPIWIGKTEVTWG